MLQLYDDLARCCDPSLFSALKQALHAKSAAVHGYVFDSGFPACTWANRGGRPFTNFNVRNSNGVGKGRFLGNVVEGPWWRDGGGVSRKCPHTHSTLDFALHALVAQNRCGPRVRTTKYICQSRTFSLRLCRTRREGMYAPLCTCLRDTRAE